MTTSSVLNLIHTSDNYMETKNINENIITLNKTKKIKITISYSDNRLVRKYVKSIKFKDSVG